MTQQVGADLLEIEKEELASMTSDVVALCEAYRTALRTTPVWKKQDHAVLEGEGFPIRPYRDFA